MKTPNFSVGFKEMLRQHPYLFHLHTNFTDGTSSIEDYCTFAMNNGYKYLIFTEHVRQVCTYDFTDLERTLEDARHRFPSLQISLGVEAKLLPNGTLDVSKEVLDRVDVLGIACHSFPSDVEIYAEAMEHVLKESYAKDLVQVWVHPGLFFKKNNILESRLFSYLLDLAIHQGVYVEYNIKYGLPPVNLQHLIPPQRKVLGIDGHSVKDLKERNEEITSIEQSFREELSKA